MDQRESKLLFKSLTDKCIKNGTVFDKCAVKGCSKAGSQKCGNGHLVCPAHTIADRTPPIVRCLVCKAEIL